MLKSIKHMQFIAKGHRGVVYSGVLEGNKVVLKLKLPESKAIYRMENEANILKIVNKKKIGPKLIFSGHDFLVMGFVEGKMILDFLEDSDKNYILNVLKNILRQCFVLDQIKIDKQEMTNPYKHILVGKKVVMIDFERAKKDLKPGNVTGFCNFLISKKVSDLLSAKKIKIDREKTFELCKKYKKSMTRQNFNKILDLLK